MFGRRARKLAEQEALKKMMEEAEANRRAQLEQEKQQQEAKAYQEAKVYYDSEIIFDEPEDVGNNFDVQNDVPNNEPIINDTPAPVIVALPVPEEEKAKEEPITDETVAGGTSEPVTETEPAVEPAKDEPTVEPIIADEPVVEPQTETTVTDESNEEELAEQSTAEHEGDEEAEPEIRYVVDGPTEDDELVKPAKLVKLPNLVDYMLSLKMSKRMKINIATLLIGAYSKFKDIPEEKAIIVGCMKKVMFALVNEK